MFTSKLLIRKKLVKNFRKVVFILYKRRPFSIGINKTLIYGGLLVVKIYRIRLLDYEERDYFF